jgi:hypothetical protein
LSIKHLQKCQRENRNLTKKKKRNEVKRINITTECWCTCMIELICFKLLPYCTDLIKLTKSLLRERLDNTSKNVGKLKKISMIHRI